jgi:hypothetical protein
MPTTPIYGLRYPQASDPADVPTDLQELALDVESKLGRPPLVTALPGSPTEGQEIYYQSAAMAALGIAWHLRYRAAANASAYKWDFVGGSALSAFVAAPEDASVSTAFVLPPTPGPDITVPLAGDYLIGYGARLGNSAAGQTTVMSLKLGALPVDHPEDVQTVPPVNQARAHVAREIRRTLAANAAIVTYILTFGGTGVWADRWLRVTPIRLG